jgi:hypothetical protein
MGEHDCPSMSAHVLARLHSMTSIVVGVDDRRMINVNVVEVMGHESSNLRFGIPVVIRDRFDHVFGDLQAGCDVHRCRRAPDSR